MNLVFFSCMYFMQGTLYGLQVRFLPVLLRRSGATLIYIGSLHLSAVPWLFKPAWAPFVDRYWNRNHWLSMTLMGIGCCLLIAFVCGENLFGMSFLLLNLFTSTHEVVLGKIAILEMNRCQYTKGTSLQIISYKLGILHGGGILLWISYYINWTTEIFSALSLIYFISVLWNLWPTKDRNSKQTLTLNELPEVGALNRKQRSFCFCEPLRDIFTSIVFPLWSSPGFKWTLMCAMVYKFPSHSSQALFTMFLVDQGMRASDIGIMFGIVGQVISVAVSAASGFALSYLGLKAKKLLVLILLLETAPLALQVMIVSSNGRTSQVIFIAMFLIQHVVHGAIAIPMYSLLFQCSRHAPRTVQATQHSLLVSGECLGKQMAVFLAGMIGEWTGYLNGLVIALSSLFFVVVLMSVCPENYKAEKTS